MLKPEKRKFDPSQKYEVVSGGKPAFDPNQSFEEVKKKEPTIPSPVASTGGELPSTPGVQLDQGLGISSIQGSTPSPTQTSPYTSEYLAATSGFIPAETPSFSVVDKSVDIQESERRISEYQQKSAELPRYSSDTCKSVGTPTLD